MFRRFLTVLVVFAFAGLLAFLQNRVMVGEQELYPTVVELAQENTYEVVLRDLAGNVVAANEEDRRLLEQRLGAHGQMARVPNAGVVRDEEDGILRFTVASQAIDLPTVRQRVVRTPFRRTNPPRSWLHIQQGIDLRGGVEFNCSLYDDDGVRVNATDEVVAILRSRLDARGLSEPQVYRLANGDVQVVIPGGTEADAARTRRVLETTGNLEFRELMARTGPGGQIIANVFEGEPGAYIEQRGNRWVFTERARSEGIRFYSRSDVILPHKPERGAAPTRFYHLGPVQLTGQDVQNAFETTHDGAIAVGITFTVPGGAKNHAFTSRLRQQGPEGTGQGSGRMAISLDGMVESAPFIQSPSSGSSVITGRFTTEEVNNLRTVLRAGSLAVRPEITSQRVVGATLGHDTVVRSLVAMVSALMVVLVFVLGYYWWRFGVVAVASLGTCLVLIVAVVSAFGATLTLPGLAGLVLTVGMAVDANILIFERIREELGFDADVDVKTCIHAGYSNAFSTIFDANITTFLTAFVLYLIGSGPVKGFGMTLMIGIVTSMFGALFVGRLVTDWLYRRQAEIRMPWGFIFPAISFVRLRFLAAACSALVVGGSLAWFFLGGSVNRNFDIDFTGGNMVQVSFTEGLTMEQVQATLATAHRADPEAHDLLDPQAMQIQPYYSGFAATGTAARQFVFKVRDERASAIDRGRVAAEAQVAAIRRQLEDLDPEQPDPARIQAIEREASALVEAEVEPLKERLAGRVEVFKQQLLAAFPDRIGAEGSELLDLAWEDGRLAVRLATTDPAPAATLSQIRLVLEQQADYEQVTAEVLENGDGIVVYATLAEGGLRPPEIMVDHVIARRAEELLADQGLDEEMVRTLAQRTKDLVSRIEQSAATVGLQLAAPFPASDFFSPQVAEQMKWRALAAIAGSILVILFYIAMRFQMRYGLGAILALVHDVLGTIGLLAVFSVRIDLTVVAAVLTIIGYSLNDTIVVYDRIRENRAKEPEGDLARVIDHSIGQTMSRTLLTSGTTLFAVLVLLFYGGDGVAAFSATMLIGMILGTYSSVFVASPALLLFPAEPEAAALESDAVEPTAVDG